MGLSGLVRTALGDGVPVGLVTGLPVGAAEALYLEAMAAEVSSRDLGEAIATYSTRSQSHGAGAWVPADVLPPARVRLYRATAESQFVLGPGDERLPVQVGK